MAIIELTYAKLKEEGATPGQIVELSDYLQARGLLKAREIYRTPLIQFLWEKRHLLDALSSNVGAVRWAVDQQLLPTYCLSNEHLLDVKEMALRGMRARKLQIRRVHGLELQGCYMPSLHVQEGRGAHRVAGSFLEDAIWEGLLGHLFMEGSVLHRGGLRELTGKVELYQVGLSKASLSYWTLDAPSIVEGCDLRGAEVSVFKTTGEGALVFRHCLLDKAHFGGIQGKITFEGCALEGACFEGKAPPGWRRDPSGRLQLDSAHAVRSAGHRGAVSAAGK